MIPLGPLGGPHGHGVWEQALAQRVRCNRADFGARRLTEAGYWLSIRSSR